MLVGGELALIVLQAGKKLAQRLTWPQPYPHRYGIDKQPNHGLDAGNLSRPARYRCAKDDVVLTAEFGKQDGPYSLKDAVEGQTQTACLLAKCFTDCFRQLML